MNLLFLTPFGPAGLWLLFAITDLWLVNPKRDFRLTVRAIACSNFRVLVRVPSRAVTFGPT